MGVSKRTGSLLTRNGKALLDKLMRLPPDLHQLKDELECGIYTAEDVTAAAIAVRCHDRRDLFGMLHPFRTAGRHQNRFHLVEFGLIPDVKFVYQHSRAGVTVIGDGVKTVSILHRLCRAGHDFPYQIRNGNIPRQKAGAVLYRLLCYFKALHTGGSKGAFRGCALSFAHRFSLLSDKKKSMPQGHGFFWSY